MRFFWLCLFQTLAFAQDPAEMQLGFRPTILHFDQTIDVGGPTQAGYAQTATNHLSFFAKPRIPINDRVVISADFNFIRRLVDMNFSQRYINQFDTFLTAQYTFHEVDGYRFEIGPAIRILTFPYVTTRTLTSIVTDSASGTMLFAGASGRVSRQFSERAAGHVSLHLETPFRFIGKGADIFSVRSGYRIGGNIAYRRYLSKGHEWFAEFELGLSYWQLNYRQTNPFLAENKAAMFSETFGVGMGWQL